MEEEGRILLNLEFIQICRTLFLHGIFFSSIIFSFKHFAMQKIYQVGIGYLKEEINNRKVGRKMDEMWKIYIHIYIYKKEN